MFAQGPDQDSPSSLRGWLSDVYFPTMLEEAREAALDALAARLGPKATVDDPIQGRATGLSSVRKVVDQTVAWLVDHAASYTRVACTSGIDRDVTEGTLSLTFDRTPIDVPVAVVAERRKSREVELRVYFATPMGAGGEAAVASARGRLVPPDAEIVMPDLVVALLNALAQGDVAGMAALFEEDGTVYDARGAEHAKGDGGLRSFFKRLVAEGGLELEYGGAADDGRTYALECTLVKTHGTPAGPRAALIAIERGDSGLARALRLYGELEPAR